MGGGAGETDPRQTLALIHAAETETSKSRTTGRGARSTFVLRRAAAPVSRSRGNLQVQNNAASVSVAKQHSEWQYPGSEQHGSRNLDGQQRRRKLSRSGFDGDSRGWFSRRGCG